MLLSPTAPTWLVLMTLTLSLDSLLSVPIPQTEIKKMRGLFQGTCNIPRSVEICPNLTKSCCCSAIGTESKWNTDSKQEKLAIPYLMKCLEIKHVPTEGLPQSAKQIIFEKTNFESLERLSFVSFNLSAVTLFTLREDATLQAINERTFFFLPKLSTIIISVTPRLFYISGSAFYGLNYLRTLRIKQTGLTFAQGFNNFGSLPGYHLTITLSHNAQLTSIQNGAFNDVGAQRSFSIEISHNPVLASIENHAFNGSVETIDLSDNPALTELSQFSFSGCAALIYLDVSNTPVKSLPDEGLQNLKELRAKNAPNLVRIPDGSRFPKLKKADLTYPYHCCALHEYGYGEIFYNEKDPYKEKVEVDCDTGEDLRNHFAFMGWGDHNNFPTFEPFNVTVIETIDHGTPYDPEGEAWKRLIFGNEYSNLPAFTEEEEANWGNEHHSSFYESNWFDSTDDFGNFDPIVTDTTTGNGNGSSKLLTTSPFARTSTKAATVSTTTASTTPTKATTSTTAPTEATTSTTAPTKATTPLTTPPTTTRATKASATEIMTKTNTPTFVKYVCILGNDGKIEKKIYQQPIQCSPAPDDFNPCEDLLGHRGLVVASWVVAGFAVLGNLGVIITILYVTFDRSRARQNRLPVPKFLILNLATADFFMGIYIFSLAVVNEKTTKSYYRFGVEWQTMGGCDAVGFLSMFASQLSIFTLSVVSLERWYAIRFAIHLEKRMSLKMAMIVMGIGWLLSILVALLPLVGINSYQKTAICLPMDVSKTSGLAYIIIVLAVDVIGFLLVVGSYVWMYFMVRCNKNKQKPNRKNWFSFGKNQNGEKHKVKIQKDKNQGIVDNRAAADARVAKKMAALVFTDFACLFPICFFSLFGLLDLPLITISTSKILLVFFYPLNSCCNPFLYAILTKSFRKDFLCLVKAIKYSETFQGSKLKFPSPKNQKKSSSQQKSDQRPKTSVPDAQVGVNGGAERKRTFSGTKVTSIRSRTASLICNSRRSSSANKAMRPTKASPHAKNDAMNTISERKSSKSDSVAPENSQQPPAAKSRFQGFLSNLGLPMLKEKSTSPAKAVVEKAELEKNNENKVESSTSKNGSAQPNKTEENTVNSLKNYKQIESKNTVHLNSEEKDTFL